MRIDLRVERGALRRWLLDLAERLARRPGAEIGFAFADEPGATSRAAERVFQIETMLFGLERGGGAERIAPAALSRFAPAGEALLTLDLTAAPLPAGARLWRVECDGEGLEPGMLAAALSGRNPVVRVLGPSGPLAVARPGAERGALTRAGFEERLARVATLIEAALDGAAGGALPAMPGEDAPAAGSWAKRGVKTFVTRAKRAVYGGLFHTPHWRVGWRRGETSLAQGVGGGWTDLPDDGRRFYADPFPIARRGRLYLFVEEFEHLKGKGVISAVEFGPNGPMGTPEPVLETGSHLSYPNVFERDGEMWMIPESCGADGVDLYRASDFPGGWKREARLVDNVEASDATLVEQDGRWWMFATVRDGGGAYSDALHLWSAPDFRGPWTAHPKNPVLIDIASARPAGRMFVRDGALMRPVQDCRAGYGAAMALMRVDRLDEGGFAQSLEAHFPPGGGWPGRRLHSYNQAGGFEFIDGSAFAPRWRGVWPVSARTAPARAAPEILRKA
jgi:hypothetical protein